MQPELLSEPCGYRKRILTNFKQKLVISTCLVSVVLEVCCACFRTSSVLLRSTILLDSKSVLRGRAISDQAIAEALVSTMLLEDSSPRQALADFLLARTASVQQLLKQPQHGTLATRTHPVHFWFFSEQLNRQLAKNTPMIIMAAKHTNIYWAVVAQWLRQ